MTAATTIADDISYHGRVGYDQQFGNIVRRRWSAKFGKTNDRATMCRRSARRLPATPSTRGRTTTAAFVRALVTRRTRRCSTQRAVGAYAQARSAASTPATRANSVHVDAARAMAGAMPQAAASSRRSRHNVLDRPGISVHQPQGRRVPCVRAGRAPRLRPIRSCWPVPMAPIDPASRPRSALAQRPCGTRLPLLRMRECPRPTAGASCDRLRPSFGLGQLSSGTAPTDTRKAAARIRSAAAALFSGPSARQRTRGPPNGSGGGGRRSRRGSCA